MGWQDAPVIDQGKPAWSSAPMVDQKAPEATAPPEKRMGNAEDAIGEPLLNAVTGAAGAVAGGLHGLYKSATTSGSFDDRMRAGAEASEKTSSDLTYQPRTKMGEMGNAIPQAVGKAVGKFADQTGQVYADVAGKLGASPEVQGGIGAGVNAVTNLAGNAILGKEAAKAVKGAVKPSAPAAPAPTNPAVELARKHGIVLKPSEAGGGTMAKTAEGLTGSPKLSIEMSVKNQPKIDKIAAEEIGVKGTLTPAARAKAKAPHNAVYEKTGRELGDVTTDEQYHADLANIGRTPGTSFQDAKSPAIDKLKEAYSEQRFNAADAIQETRKLRAAATKNIKAPFDPERNELGFAQRQISDAIENQMERHGEAIGKGELISEFRNARQQLAKIHSVEAAMTGATGEVSAKKLAQMQSKGVPLSGNLKDIAEIANNFPHEVRAASSVKNKVPVTALEGAFAVGAEVAKKPWMIPAIAARPLTRQFLMSDMYQNTLRKSPSMTLKDWSGKDVPNVQQKPSYTSKPAVQKPATGPATRVGRMGEVIEKGPATKAKSKPVKGRKPDPKKYDSASNLENKRNKVGPLGERVE